MYASNIVMPCFSSKAPSQGLVSTATSCESGWSAAGCSDLSGCLYGGNPSEDLLGVSRKALHTGHVAVVVAQRSMHPCKSMRDEKTTIRIHDQNIGSKLFL